MIAVHTGMRAALLGLAGLLAVAVASAARAEQAYTVTLSGVEDGPLRTALSEASNLMSLAETPPPSLVALRRRADEDGPRLARVLASRGYLAGDVSIDMQTDTDPVAVTIQVTPGPQYTFAAVEMAFRGAEPPLDPAAVDLPAKPGEPVLSSRIRETAEAIEAALRREGYALAEVVDQRAEIDHAARTVAITFVAETGALARFGPTIVNGLVSLDDTIVRDRLAWREGETFDPAKIADTRSALLDTRLFASVKIEPTDEAGPDGSLPVTVTVAEAEPRSIGFGLRYSTSQGPGGKVFWEHRNFLGDAELFRAEARGSFVERAGELGFVRPLFLDPDQDLHVDFLAIDEEPDAYERLAVGGTVSVVRQLDELHSARLGVAGEYSRVRDAGGERRFVFGSLPASVDRDTTDDLFDPTRGHRVELSFTPFFPVGGDGTTFTRSRLTGSTYWDLVGDGSVIAAGRASVGTIAGAALTEVPADKRFYAGGGGSIRGFGFRRAGELDAGDDPVGGRSVAEVGLELRVRIGEDFGVVPFIEAGRAYSGTLPDLEERLFVGAGLGLRYYTGIGPLRLDVGVPLNKRDSDAPFQIYVSLGQAF